MTHASRTLAIALAVTLTPPAVLPTTMLAASTLGIGLDRGVCIALAALSAACGLVLAWWLVREFGAPTTAPPPPCARRPERVLLALLVGLACAFWVFAWSSLAAVALGRPVIDWDGLYYHVPAVHGWVRAGRIVWIEGMADVPFVNGYPMHLEALAMWSVQVLGHDRWIDATNLLLWPVGGLGLALCAHRLGARGGWLLLAGLAPAFVPAVLASSATAYVDVGFFCVTAAAIAVTLWRLQAPRGRALAVLWGLGIGGAMGIKGTGIPFGVLLSAVVLVRALRMTRAERPQAVRLWLLGVAVALAVGGGWPLRALVHTGNPLHPIELRLGGKVLAEGVDPFVAADLAMPDALRALPAPLRGPVTWLRPFTPITRYDQVEGLGPLWTLAGWPALFALGALALWRREGALVALMVAAVLWWFLQPAAWWARFSLWILALGWPAAIAFFSSAWCASDARSRGTALAVATLVLGLSTWVCAPVLDHERSWRTHFAAEGVSASDAMGARWSTLSQQPAFVEALARERVARSRVDRLGSLLAGALAQPVGTREIFVVDVEDRSAIADRMRALELRWLLWDEATVGTLGPEPTDLPPGLIRADSYDLGGSRVVLLRLP